MRIQVGLRALAAAAILIASPAGAQGVRPFYRGKTIYIDVGAEAGGAYDAYARLVAQDIGRFIPGSPTVVVRDMDGAASMIAAEHLYNSSPRDGTELGVVLHTMPITQLMDPVKFPIKPADFEWIGTVADPTELLAVWYKSGVRSVEDAKKKAITVGATTPGEDLDMFPRIADSLLGTKFIIIDGYSGGPAITMAMQNGEVQGLGSNSWVSYTFQHADWIKTGKIVPLFQGTFTRDPLLPNVPTLIELGENSQQKQILSILTTADSLGNPFIAPPGVPADRVNILRHAFESVTKDPLFQAQAKKAHLVISPIYGDKLQSMVDKMMGSPPDIIKKFRVAVSAPG